MPVHPSAAGIARAPGASDRRAVGLDQLLRRAGPWLHHGRNCIAATVPFVPGTANLYLRRGAGWAPDIYRNRSEEHTSELQSRLHLVCRLLLEKKKVTKRGAGIQISRRFVAVLSNTTGISRRIYCSRAVGALTDRLRLWTCSQFLRACNCG